VPGRTGKQCRERWTSKVRASAQHNRPPPLPPSALAHGGKVTDRPRGLRPAARPERPAGAVVQAGGREADLLTSQVRSSSSCSKRARTHPPTPPAAAASLATSRSSPRPWPQVWWAVEQDRALATGAVRGSSEAAVGNSLANQAAQLRTAAGGAQDSARPAHPTPAQHSALGVPDLVAQACHAQFNQNCTKRLCLSTPGLPRAAAAERGQRQAGAQPRDFAPAARSAAPDVLPGTCVARHSR
jgi:hypothetical protein